MLLEFYNRADASTLAVGRAWYRDASDACARMAAEHGTSLQVAAGVVAALSPRMPWSRNLWLAREVLAGARTGCLAGSIDKAARIIAGADPLTVLGGPKTRAFYRALTGESDAIVVDVWMLRALGHGRDSCTPRQYETFARSILESARAVGERPADFQAIVWCVIRGGSE